MVGGCHFDLDPGDSTTVDFSYTPEKAGKSSVTVCTRQWNDDSQQYDYIPFIADSIDVTTSPKANLDISLSVDNITDGYIKENAIKLKASIKNNGANVYDNIIKAELYKDKHDGSGYYSFEKRMTQTVTIENGQTIDVNFNFENLEDDNYIILVSYISEGKWVDVQKSYTVYTRPIPKISTTPQTINAVKENGAWYVKADSALVSVKVKNIGTVDYDDDIIIDLFKMYNENSGNRVATVKKPIQLATGADTTVVMQLDGLEDGAKYFYNVLYTAGPKTVRSAQSNILTVKLEEKGYYLVSDLNGWSTTDQSYPFIKLDDGKTWEITFPAENKDIYLKVAPASAYDHQNEFWSRLLCAPQDQWTDLTGSMVVNGGAWLLPASFNAETYTMQIVPSEMTYTITYTEKTDGIQLISGNHGNVIIYDLNGNKVAETKTTDVQQHLRSLPKGLYIIRSGQKTKTIRN